MLNAYHENIVRYIARDAKFKPCGENDELFLERLKANPIETYQYINDNMIACANYRITRGLELTFPKFGTFKIKCYGKIKRKLLALNANLDRDEAYVQARDIKLDFILNKNKKVQPIEINF